MIKVLGKMMTSDPSYGDEKRKLLGLNIAQINAFSLQSIIYPYCLYNNKDCSSDLHWYWHYDYGNCFQFNVGLNFSDSPIDLKMSKNALKLWFALQTRSIGTSLPRTMAFEQIKM